MTANKLRKPPARYMRIEADPFGGGLIRLTVGKEATVYRTVMIPCDPEFGPYAMEFAKLDESLHVAEVYHLTVSHGIPERVACDCMGFVAHGHCKHADCLTKILHDQFNEPIPADILAAFGQVKRDASKFQTRNRVFPGMADLDHV